MSEVHIIRKQGQDELDKQVYTATQQQQLFEETRILNFRSLAEN